MSKEYNFDEYKKDSLTKPRDLAWSNWAKFEKVGDKVQGYIRDAFYRKEDGQFKDQRGITLEQPDGTLINVGIKRYDFVLDKTNDMRIGDPLTVVLEELKPAQTKGYNATKIFGFYGKALEENKNNPTVAELDRADEASGGSSQPEEVQEESDDPVEAF